MNRTTGNLERAIQSLRDRIQLDITTNMQVTAGEFVHRGYGKAQMPLGRAVNERVTDIFRQSLQEDTRNWIDAGSAAETPTTPYSPGAAEWVTTGPRAAALTLYDDECILALRARMLLPIAPAGSECAYRPSNHRVACSERLDVYVMHSHGCA